MHGWLFEIGYKRILNHAEMEYIRLEGTEGEERLLAYHLLPHLRRLSR